MSTVLIGTALISDARGELSLPDIFSDNMVLQRDQKISIWGKAAPGDTIILTFAGKEKKAKAGSNGNWHISLPPLPASSKGRTLKVASKKSNKVLEFKNILVGDVWLAGGQSNMEWCLKDSKKGKNLYRDLDNPMIRSVRIGKYEGWQEERPETTPWLTANGEQSGEFSAVAHFFAEEIYQKIQVPIGIINCNLGASTCEAWISRDFLKKYRQFKPLIAQYERDKKNYNKETWLKYNKDVQTWYQIKNEDGDAAAGPFPAMVPSPYSRIAAGNLYDHMLSEIIPFSIKGVIWYQGEANHHNPKVYGALFQVLIKNWRKEFKQPDLPFYFVQLSTFWGWDDAGFQTPFWAEIREGQFRTAKTTANTAMAVSSDWGERLEIHPANKQPIGHRLALLARKHLYGEKDLIASGPVYKSYTVEGEKIRIIFEDGTGDLKKDTILTGFEISGADHVFYEAKAVFDQNTILLTSEKVAKPAYARYNWANWFVPTLFNEDGLPASSFRTHPAQ